MADGTIVNENDRTGVLDIEGEIARAAAEVHEQDHDGADNAAEGPDVLSQSIESFTKPGGGKNGPTAMAQTGLAAEKPKSIGPFIVASAKTTPFTLMSPTTNLNRSLRGPMSQGPGGPKPKGPKGKSKHKDHGKVGVVSAYGGGLQEISGAKMPGPSQLQTMALDPQLLEALQNEKRKMQDPHVQQGAEQLNAQDFRNLQQTPDYMDRGSDRNALTQRLSNSKPRL